MNDSLQVKSSVSNDQGSVSFPCPRCGKGPITRTKNERQIIARYTCPHCGFEGPN